MRRSILISIAVVVGCSTPDESAHLDQFISTVIPVLERRCAVGCHAVVGEVDPSKEEWFFFPVDEMGRVTTQAQIRATYESASKAKARIDLEAPPDFSPILRVPLDPSLGGGPHRGVGLFTSLDDPDYVALREWVANEIRARATKPAAASAEAAFFRDRVLGVLVRNGCFLQSCHGADVFNDLKLRPPMPRADLFENPAAAFAPSDIRKNRELLLGTVARFANLGGDLMRSRLIVKNIPLSEGGVHQRGGNGHFFAGLDDPDVRILERWMKLERHAVASRLESKGRSIPPEDLGRVRAIAFIRAPRHAPRRFFDMDPFWPGSSIQVADLTGTASGTIDLTRDLFGGARIEVQSIDVRYDGRAIAFSARTAEDEGFRIYEIDLTADLKPSQGRLRIVTSGPNQLPDGTLVHHIDPIYMPGPHDHDGSQLDDVIIAYASNESGEYAASSPFGWLGEADESADAGVVFDRQRTEATGTFDGRRLSIVDGPHRGESRRIIAHKRVAVGSVLRLDRPLSAPADARTVYVIEEIQPTYLPAYDIWRIVPGRPETARKMTFTSAQERRPTTRTTGEVMFTSVRNIGYQARRPVFNGAIFRAQAGGFDYHIHGGNRSRYPLFADARELPSGLEVRLALDPRNLWGGGTLMLADHGFGVDLEPDNPVDGIAFTSSTPGPSPSAQRFLPALAPFVPEPDMTPTGVSPRGAFRDPYPLPDGRVLVARVRDPIEHLSPGADPNWDVVFIKPVGALQSRDGGRVGPFVENPLRAASTTAHAEYGARPIVVRLKEHVHTHQKFAHRDDDLEPKDVDGVLRMPEGTPAELECYDYPLLQSFLTNFAPVGPRDFRLDALRSVRIVAHRPPHRDDVVRVDAPDPWATPVSAGIHSAKQIVAEIPLQPDGSFYARVPAEVPLIVQGLNRWGMAVHSMNRWFYLQPGEKLTFSIPRSIFPLRCSGCHGALTGDPVDTLGPPDLVTSASEVMATWDADDKRRRAPASIDLVSIDFVRDVQPILDKRCVSCHAGEGPLDLRGDRTRHYTVAYESLHALDDPGSGDFARKKYIDERHASSASSFLFEKLLGRELEAERTLKARGTPHPSESPLLQSELQTLIRWVDLGATFTSGESR